MSGAPPQPPFAAAVTAKGENDVVRVPVALAVRPSTSRCTVRAGHREARAARAQTDGGGGGGTPGAHPAPPRNAQPAAIDDKVLPCPRAAHRVEKSGHHCAPLLSRAGASRTRARAGGLTHRRMGCLTSVVFRPVAHGRICRVPCQEPRHLPRALSPRMSSWALVDPTVLRHDHVDWLLQWTFGRQCRGQHPTTATSWSECRQRE